MTGLPWSMAERHQFDARAFQLGVAFGAAAGVAAWTLFGNLGYWLSFGILTGGAVAYAVASKDLPGDVADE